MDAALTAVEIIQCSHVVALQFQIALFKHKMPLESEGVYGHPFKVACQTSGSIRKKEPAAGLTAWPTRKL